MLSGTCWHGAIEGIAPFFRWSGWSMKIPLDDDDDHCSAELSQTGEASGLTVRTRTVREALQEIDMNCAGGVAVASDEADKGSDAVTAVLMHHLKPSRDQVRIALKAAVQSRRASEILMCCQDAKAVGVARAEIDEALAVAANIRAASAYETVMQGGGAADIIHCLGCVSHLSHEQTAELEKRLAAEAYFLSQNGDWRCARDILCAAKTAGVSSLRDANGEKTIGSLIEETYSDEAMEEVLQALLRARITLSEACATIEATSSDRDISEMRTEVQLIRDQTARVLCACSRRHYRSGYHECCCGMCPDGCVAARTEEQRRPTSLRLGLLEEKGLLGGHPSLSTVSTSASESLANFGDVLSPKTVRELSRSSKSSRTSSDQDAAPAG